MTFLIVSLLVFFVGGAVYVVATPPASKFEREDNERRKAEGGENG